MTVAELRAKLEEFPDDLVVIASVRDGEPIKDIRQADNWRLGQFERKNVALIT